MMPSSGTYPRLEIDVRKLEDNARTAVRELAARGITLMGVNKVFNGLPETAAAIVRAGMKTVAESRIANLRALRHLDCEKCLLRSPGPSEIEDAIRYADISLNSDIEILRALSREAVRQDRPHKILLMVDMGDLREGIWHGDRETLISTTRELLSLPRLEIYGLGTNFNCYGTILPSIENGSAFVRLARELEAEFSIRFPYLSGGSSTSYGLIDQGAWPEGLNHLRIGGLHQFGLEYVAHKHLAQYHHSSMDVSRATSPLYQLRAEVLEVNVKPTVPQGQKGKDAFLQPKTFVDRGNRRRAILSLGRQDVPYSNIWPTDPAVTILGQTSDHTLLDIQDCERCYRVGDIISFELDYTALLFASNAPGIRKVMIS